MDIVRMDRSALPPEEQEIAQSIEHNLLTLHSLAEEFRQTVGLYLFAHGRKQIFSQRMRGGPEQFSWNDFHDNKEMVGLIKIAGRNGAVMASSFLEITQAINATQKDAPTIWAKADKNERNKGSKLFVREFPQISRIRHSAAHPGEFASTADELGTHKLKGSLTNEMIQSGPGTYMEGMMAGSPDGLNFGATVYGDYVQYRLSMEKAHVLDAVVSHYSRTFYPLEHAQAAQRRAWMQESDSQRQQDRSDHPPWWHSLIQL